jgi:aminoglycoside phosphotransferase (APT) family kinase protein
VVELADGRSAFVKAAVNDLTAGWLRKEHRMYSELRAPFMADLLGWADEDDLPMLVLEDLSGCAWPPPWSDDRLGSALAMLEQVAATSPPTWLTPSAESAWIADGWARVADDPAPLLSTGIVSAAWLDQALPVLLDVARPEVIAGDRLCHFDVRSDNMCFRADGSAVLVDWNLAEIGNARLDIAFWLPSLLLEGGPAPESVLPDAAPEAAVVAGFFASRCGLPRIPDAPTVRDFQKRQLWAALPWACRVLSLPPHRSPNRFG